MVNLKMILIKVDIIYKIIFSILSAFIIFFLSFDQNIWNFIWGSLSIPPQSPFSDLKAHIQFFNCFENGINVFIQNCNLIPEGTGKVTTHPKIWLYFVKYLNLESEMNYNLFLIFILSLYFYCLIDFFFKNKKYKIKVFIILFVISTTNLILIERFATDIIIFILVYFTLSTNKKLLQAILIFFGLVLKHYPIFLTSIFIKYKKFLIIVSIIYILFIYNFYLEEIKLVNNNILEIALMIAYGSRTLAKSFYHLSLEYNLLIYEENYKYFRDLVLLAFCFAFLLLLACGYRYSKLNNKKVSHKTKTYFIGGASIYAGTFILGSNFDYRLIFLIFTVPYLMSLTNKKIRNLMIICYAISLNSFLFQHGELFINTEIINIIYYLKSSLIFFCKITIFAFLSYLLGSYLKDINFFKLK
jgi:hypothetical protein